MTCGKLVNTISYIYQTNCHESNRQNLANFWIVRTRFGSSFFPLLHGRKSNREGRKGLKYPHGLTFQHNPLIVLSSFRPTLGNALITSFNEENGDLKLVAKPAIRLPSEETRARIFSRHFISL